LRARRVLFRADHAWATRGEEVPFAIVVVGAPSGAPRASSGFPLNCHTQHASQIPTSATSAGRSSQDIDPARCGSRTEVGATHQHPTTTRTATRTAAIEYSVRARRLLSRDSRMKNGMKK